MRGLKFFSLPVIVSGLAVLLTVSCKQRVRVLKSPPNYNFAFATVTKLSPRLQDISGIVWDQKNKQFMAINDNSDTLFVLDRSSRAINQAYALGNKGDYEDLAIYNGATYILRSDGMITKFSPDSIGNPAAAKMGEISIAGPNDFETLYADPDRKALILLCKNCKGDDEKTISAYAFYPDTKTFDNKPVYTIDAEEITKLSPFEAPKFQPSAAAIHPVTKKLFILSAASKQLVIADLNGKVDSVYKLSAEMFPQPEGITFGKNGEMYITNVGVGGKSTFIIFRYKNEEEDTDDTDKPMVYDFANPDEKMELGNQLHEISGMAWIPGKNMILAENDEKGKIITVDFKNRNDHVSEEKFGGKGDYEDIVYNDGVIYMLISYGSIVKVTTEDSELVTKEFDLPEKGNNEFETLYLDEDRNSLIMLCKECSKEKKTEIRTAYRFDLGTESYAPEPAYTIDVNKIREKINDKEALFKPSAAAINPVDGKLYIVASVGKLLVVADKNTGDPEKVIRLDEKLFNQPEGITITPEGDIYISNEGGGGIATILRFKRKK